MIAKELYISNHDWCDILSIVDRLTEEYNIIGNKFNDKIRTIQFSVNDIVFCEYEFDETHKRMLHLTADGKAQPILTIGDFIRSVRDEMEKMDDIVYYYLSRKNEEQ